MPFVPCFVCVSVCFEISVEGWWCDFGQFRFGFYLVMTSMTVVLLLQTGMNDDKKGTLGSDVVAVSSDVARSGCDVDSTETDRCARVETGSRAVEGQQKGR